MPPLRLSHPIMRLDLNLSRAWFSKTFWSLLLCLSLQACVTPSDKLNQFANEQGFLRSTMKVKGFELLAYQNWVQAPPDQTQRSEPFVLHVYLEGDGSPWRYRTVVMPDPTPRRPLMLELMTVDPQWAMYLGRPCYNGTSRDPGCDNRLWTSARYSPQVVDSMAAAIRVVTERHQVDEIRLFGHSGGGALAVLLAEQLPKVGLVVTIAGNLDTDAWTDHHGYTPLFTSLNPALRPPLKESVQQWHLVGGRDAVIPPQLVRPYIEGLSDSVGHLFSGYDHGCCWGVIWPDVLRAVNTGDSRKIPGQRFKSAERESSALESL